MIGLLLKPDVEDQQRDGEDKDPVHIICDGCDPDADYWIMFCGLVVRAYDDGTLDPPTDFYHSDVGYKASCKACLDRWKNA
jgi:hypothetical protein